MPRTARRNGRAGGRESAENTRYPNIRRAIAYEYADLPNEDVEAIVARTFGPGVQAEMVEGFFDDLGRGLRNFGRQAAPYVAPVLSGVASGAATGAALGPWGALAGGLLGGVTSGIGAAQQPRGQAPSPRRPQPPPGGALSPAAISAFRSAGMPGAGPIPGMAGAPGAGAPGAASAGGPAGGPGMAGMLGGLAPALAPMVGRASPAAGNLLALLARPEVGQALMSMFMGQAGRTTTNVAGTPVPVNAVTGLLGALAQQAEAEFAALAPESAAIPRYLLNEYGEAVVDPAVPEARAARLLTLFHEAIAEDAAEAFEQANRQAARPTYRYAAQAEPEGSDEAFFDWMDMMNLANAYDGEYDGEDEPWGG